MIVEDVHEALEQLNKTNRQFAECLEPIYRVLNWTWGMDNDKRFPSSDEITETLNHFVVHSCKMLEDGVRASTISSGGLSVSYNLEDGNVTRSFEHSDCYWFGDD